MSLRWEVTAFASKNGDIYITASCNFTHQARKTVIEIPVEGIELFRSIQSDNGDFATVKKLQLIFQGRHYKDSNIESYQKWKREEWEISGGELGSVARWHGGKINESPRHV